MHHGEHALGFLFAQQAVVHEHTSELVADGAVHQRRGHRRVHASRQRADHPTRTDLGADALDRFGDERACVPGGLAAANAVEEVAQDLAPARCVHDLGVELDAVDTLAVGEGGHR